MLDASAAWTTSGSVAPAAAANGAQAAPTWVPPMPGLADISGVGLGLLIALAILAYWYRRVL